ncbi:MAG TPA: amino acid permease [Candidatus Saccharicenans sp.]|jgi:APA family basic amino acid/polyamine antiporter|nr:amino acid permease [Candidatus Saccharicenans sp.]HRD01665.1 amino acid permease [Candidatus Saccharicenans sp.]
MDTESKLSLNQPKNQLPRVFGLFDVTSIVIGGIIGSGIFMVPSEIAGTVKSPLLMLAVWVVGGFLSFLGALGLAELGAAMPEAGGIYVYLREAYGSFISFLFGWTLFFVIDSGAIATLAVAFSSNYLPYFIKMSPLATRLVAAAFVIFLATVNYFGARQGGNLQNLLTVIKTAGIIGICVAVFFSGKGNPANFVNPGSGKFSLDLMSSFGIALIATFWAYKGWETATYSAGEVKNPEKNLPLGILIGLFGVIIIYLLANLAYLYVLPTSAIASSQRVAADAMMVAVGPLGASIICIIILFSILGSANQNMLCSPRVYYAMAQDKLFFKAIARLHPKFKTPYVSIIAISLWSIVLSLSGTFQQLFTYVIFGEWIFFGLTVAAVFILRRKRPDLPRPYKTWGYPWAPALFVLATLAISVNSLIKQFLNSMAGLGIILLGAPAYLYWKKKQQD